MADPDIKDDVFTFIIIDSDVDMTTKKNIADLFLSITPDEDLNGSVTKLERDQIGFDTLPDDAFPYSLGKTSLFRIFKPHTFNIAKESLSKGD